MNKILPSLFKFLEYSPVVLAVVLPLLFVPATTEYFETAKVSFFYIFTSLMFVVWGIKMVYEKRVSFVRSPLDVAFALLVVGFALVTFFSPNKYLAFFGGYLRFVPSLAFVLGITVLYYTVSSNLKNRSVQIYTATAYILSVALASFIALLSYFGVFGLAKLPVSLAFLGGSAFNTVGSLSGLCVLAASAFVLALSLLGAKLPESGEKGKKSEKSEKSEKSGRYILTFALFPLLAVILAYSTPAGWVVLFVGALLLFVFEPGILAKTKTVLAPLVIWAVLLLVVIFTPQTSKALKLNRPAEITLPLGQSWQIASQTITSQPVFGAGLGQFPNLFTILKPVSFNNLNVWSLRFDRPQSEMLLILAEAGAVGVAVYLLLIARIINLCFGLKNKEPMAAGLAAAALSLVVALFVTVGSSTLYVSLILLLAILIAMEENEGSKLAERVVVMISTIKDKLFGTAGAVIPAKAGIQSLDPSSRAGMTGAVNQVLPYIMMGIAVLTGLAATAATVLAYTAEVYNRQAIIAVAKNDGRGAYESEVRALSFNPYVDVYQRNLAQIAMGVAVNLSSRTNVNDADKQTVQNLIQEAIRRVRIASEIINPVNVSNWETRAQIYQGLIGVAEGAEQWTVDSYAQAISLDPGNPNLRVQLGGVYFGIKSYDLAGNSFAQAINLKPDLANPHYNLAQAFIMLKQNANALSQYDVVLNLIGTTSPDYVKAKEERDALAKLVSEEAASNAQAQGANSAGPVPAAAQEKLQVTTPKPALPKSNVTPPIDLGNPKEASPAAQQ